MVFKMVYVDTERCIGFGRCLSACSEGALKLRDGVAWIDQQKCSACGACIEACPEGAIAMVKSENKLLPVVPESPAALGPLTPRTVTSMAQVYPTRSLLGTALTFLGREVVPRVVAVLLEERPRSGEQPRQTADGQPRSAARNGDAARGQRRYRHGRNG